MSDIRVSAIVTTYQLERYVAEAIASIQAQTRPVDEIVVVDNGSTDSTVAIVRDLAERDPRISLLQEEARGASHVRNCGLRAARCDVIAFLDGDDVWPKTKIANQLAMLQTSPDLQVTTGQTAMVRAIDPMTLEPPPTATWLRQFT